MSSVRVLHHTAKVSEQVNRKCSPSNTILQLLTPIHLPCPPAEPLNT